MTAIMVTDQIAPGDNEQCPNCAAILNGPFCASCGQRQMDLDQPFRDIAGEAMESFLSVDTRILRTLWPPGCSMAVVVLAG